jgi:hypothetical protein
MPSGERAHTLGVQIEVDWLDGDMSLTDLADALRQLRFPASNEGFRAVRIDSAARDYIAACIELRVRKCG